MTVECCLEIQMRLALLDRSAAQRAGLRFSIVVRGEQIECFISRDALEQHFWLTHDADDARLQRVFEDGYERIAAAAERKVLAGARADVVLFAADFGNGR